MTDKYITNLEKQNEQLRKKLSIVEEELECLRSRYSEMCFSIRNRISCIIENNKYWSPREEDLTSYRNREREYLEDLLGEELEEL
jgi:hypothetical protein